MFIYELNIVVVLYYKHGTVACSIRESLKFLFWSVIFIWIQFFWWKVVH